VHTRASLTDILARILARKIARRVGQVGEDPRACSARGEQSYSCGKLGSRRTRRHLRDDARAEVGEDVRVGVGAVECQLQWRHASRENVGDTAMPVSRRMSSDMGPFINSCTSTSSFSLTGAVPVAQTDHARPNKNELSIHVIVSFIDMLASTYNVSQIHRAAN